MQSTFSIILQAWHFSFLVSFPSQSLLVFTTLVLYIFILAIMSSLLIVLYLFGSVAATASSTSATAQLSPSLLLEFPVAVGLVFFPGLWSLYLRYISATFSEWVTLLVRILRVWLWSAPLSHIRVLALEWPFMFSCISMMIREYSFKYKTSGGPLSQKKEDMEPSTSHSISRLKFKMPFYLLFTHSSSYLIRISWLFENILLNISHLEEPKVKRR